jgi:hypothetical protein
VYFGGRKKATQSAIVPRKLIRAPPKTLSVKSTVRVAVRREELAKIRLLEHKRKEKKRKEKKNQGEYQPGPLSTRKSLHIRSNQSRGQQ